MNFTGQEFNGASKAEDFCQGQIEFPSFFPPSQAINAMAGRQETGKYIIQSILLAQLNACPMKHEVYFIGVKPI
jgi:hypothetical protein